MVRRIGYHSLENTANGNPFGKSTEIGAKEKRGAQKP
jgi:hypothetical protein